MNKNEYENDMTRVLTPEEDAYIDRMLRETADFDDSRVDYDAILEGVRRKAAAEGIAIFPAKKKPAERKRSRVIRGILSGFGAAAAVFLVGIATFALLDGTRMKANAPSANHDGEPHEHTASICTKEPEISDAPVLQPTFDAVTEAPSETDGITSEPDPTLLPTFAPADPVVITELPTREPTKGDTVTVIAIAAPDGKPETASDLIPQELPDAMTVEESGSRLEVTAEGEDGAFYRCRAVEEAPADIKIGELRCSENYKGVLNYVWRIDEDTCLEFEFRSFTRETAEELIRSITFGERG